MKNTKRILAVVVLYKMTFEQSRGLRSLLKIISENKDAADAIDLMVCASDRRAFKYRKPRR